MIVHKLPLSKEPSIQRIQKTFPEHHSVAPSQIMPVVYPATPIRPFALRRHGSISPAYLARLIFQPREIRRIIHGGRQPVSTIGGIPGSRDSASHSSSRAPRRQRYAHSASVTPRKAPERKSAGAISISAYMQSLFIRNKINSSSPLIPTPKRHAPRYGARPLNYPKPSDKSPPAHSFTLSQSGSALRLQVIRHSAHVFGEFISPASARRRAPRQVIALWPRTRCQPQKAALISPSVSISRQTALSAPIAPTRSRERLKP